MRAHAKTFTAGADKPAMRCFAFERYNGHIERFDPLTREVLESGLPG